MSLVAPTAAPLVLIQDDAEYVRIKRAGRFSILREVAVPAGDYCLAPEQFPYFGQMVKIALKKMQANIRKTHGLEYVHDGTHAGFNLRGPAEHVEFSGDTRPDPGPLQMPKGLDDASLREWEADAKAKTAVRQLPQDVVDYEIVATFRKRLPSSFHTAAVHAHTRKER